MKKVISNGFYVLLIIGLGSLLILLFRAGLFDAVAVELERYKETDIASYSYMALFVVLSYFAGWALSKFRVY